MELTVLSHRHEPRHAAEFARAAANMIEPDAAEVQDFCDRLTGLNGETYMDVCDEVGDLAMPGGFLHARAFDAADGIELSSAVSRTNRPLTGAEITMLVTLQERFEDHAWVKTTPLPIIDRGVLDLLIHFEPRRQTVAA